MIFRQLFDGKSSTYTYLLGDSQTREAVLIDPVFEQAERDIALIRELDLKLLYTLDTHVHADHVTGASILRTRLGSQVCLSKASGAAGADRYLKDGDRVQFGRRHLSARATPGHTDGCMSYLLDDGSRIFTGDALLIRGAGRTDFQQGDAATLYRSVHEQILSLPPNTLIYPGHDYHGRTVTSVSEERVHNPRLGGQRSVGDFVGYMNNLGLPHPKLMAEAVPANLLCGEPKTLPAPAPSWAPVVRTFANIPELDPAWVAEHRSAIRIIDVREPEEFDGELSHIETAQLIPLAELRDRSVEWDRDQPIVLVCRSGGRSAQGSVILEKAGFRKVANLAGGMIGWRAADLPVASKSPETN